MFVTRRAGYAVRSVLYLTKNNKDIVTINEISESMHVPRTFLAKILQQLTSHGIVNSVQGLKGGFRLARDPESITLLEVVEAIQGVSAPSQCAIDEKSCELIDTCPVHPVWVKVRKMVENELKTHNFRTLAESKKRPVSRFHRFWG